jgi:hypothetical protein
VSAVVDKSFLAYAAALPLVVAGDVIAGWTPGEIVSGAAPVVCTAGIPAAFALAGAVRRVRGVTRRWERACRRAAPGAVASPAHWLTAVAVGGLPARERARYAEEWFGVLRDLSAVPRPRRAQLGFALGLLLRLATMRRAVAADRRSPAGGG